MGISARVSADIHTANDCVIRRVSRNGYIEVVKWLIEKGADIHAANDYALRWASRNGHLEVVRFLLEKGADICADNYVQ